jgi:hypothetical protein
LKQATVNTTIARIILRLVAPSPSARPDPFPISSASHDTTVKTHKAAKMYQ